MKSIYTLLLVSPLCLNAMIFKAPDVTDWQNICKNEQNKKELVALYKNFCQERVSNNIKWAAASFIPLIIPNTIYNALQEASGKIPVNVRNTIAQTKEHMLQRILCMDRNSLIMGSNQISYNQVARIALGLFALRQTYLLGRNGYRNYLATQDDLSCLNNDVLEQLGNPKIRGHYIYYHKSNEKYARILGLYVPYKTWKWWDSENYRIYNVNAIKRALAGKHPE